MLVDLCVHRSAKIVMRKSWSKLRQAKEITGVCVYYVCVCVRIHLSLSLSLAFYVHMCIYACTGAFCACILECLGLDSLDSPQLFFTHYLFAYRACPQFKKFERGQGCGMFFSGTI